MYLKTKIRIININSRSLTIEKCIERNRFRPKKIRAYQTLHAHRKRLSNETIATHMQWKKIFRVNHRRVHCRRWPILWTRIKRILTSSVLEWATAKTPLLPLIEACVTSNHACAHIQKLGSGFCSPFAFKFADEVREYRWNPGPVLAAIYARHFKKRERDREKQRQEQRQRRDRNRDRNRDKDRQRERERESRRDKHTKGRWMRTCSRDGEKEREQRSWETERRAEGRRRKIGADGTDGRGRAMNEMRLGRPPAKTKCIHCSRVSWRCEGKLWYVPAESINPRHSYRRFTSVQ